MSVIGHNTVAGQELRGFIERIERVRKQKKQLSKDESAIFAEAKAKGYDQPAMRHALKARDMKPHDLQKWETTRDTYMHAVGLGHEPPLFRQLQAMSEDMASVDRVMDHMKSLVPPNGEIIFKAGLKPMRLWRDKEGIVHSEEYRPAAANSPPGASSIPETQSEPVPDVDADGAEQLGREAYKGNKPIMANPFPFGDARVARWDRGWRAESGSDGMGPGNGN